MLAKLKNFVKNNSSDIFIVLIVILVALISFGIGKSTAPKSEPILIKNLEQGNVEDTKADYQGKVVGSSRSETY